MIDLKALLDKYKRIEGDCWRFNDVLNKSRRGHIRVDDDKLIQIHRLSVHVYLGLDLNSDLCVLHKIICTYSDCFNPEHLYVGTHSDNTRDIIRSGHYVSNYGELQKSKTHCPQGHEYTSDNTTLYRGRRNCKQCARERSLAHYHKRKKELFNG